MKRSRSMTKIINDLNKAQAVRFYRSSCHLAFLKGILVGVIISFTTMALFFTFLLK